MPELDIWTWHFVSSNNKNQITRAAKTRQIQLRDRNTKVHTHVWSCLSYKFTLKAFSHFARTHSDWLWTRFGAGILIAGLLSHRFCNLQLCNSVYHFCKVIGSRFRILNFFFWQGTLWMHGMSLCRETCIRGSFLILEVISHLRSGCSQGKHSDHDKMR